MLLKMHFRAELGPWSLLKASSITDNMERCSGNRTKQKALGLQWTRGYCFHRPRAHACARMQYLLWSFLGAAIAVQDVIMVCWRKLMHSIWDYISNADHVCHISKTSTSSILFCNMTRYSPDIDIDCGWLSSTNFFTHSRVYPNSMCRQVFQEGEV